MSEPSNPPAFPSGLDQNAEYSRTFQSPMHEGMTLRDYFAAQALTGLLFHYAADQAISADPCKSLSRTSYDYADAMLAEREKKK